MGTRLILAGGLAAGALAGGLAVAVLLLAPAPAPAPSASPVAVASPSPAAPSASAAPPTATTTAAPSPSASAGPGASPAPSPSVDEIAALFGIGSPAPALSLPLAAGGTVDLALLRGHPVWINFMASWCPSCVDELPVMSGFAARYADTGLIVIAVDVQEDAATAAAFTKGLGVTFPVAVDADGSALSAWGALALPVHYFVDASGVVRDGALGQVGPDIMAGALGRILPGVDVTP